MTEFHRLKPSDNISEFNFKSGNTDLDNFFLEDSIDFIEHGYSQLYYFKEEEGVQIIGYFAVCCSSIKFKKTIIDYNIKISYIPCLLLGRLAIDEKFQRRNFGSKLLKKCISLASSISKRIGCRLVIVDALTKLRVLKFYKKLGFEYLDNRNGDKIEKALKRNQEPSRRTIKMIFDLNKIKSN
ncbi:MAG: GNAT family N-acetyltransferase [Candidatus Lokiarchaeota archaeon]|nr:GNAT family N-acetyltransferase [Candidatus Lokiarchaeota archaeon]